MEHMMLLVTYRMLPGQRDAFLQEVAAAGILAKVQQEDGFERYDYYLSAAPTRTICSSLRSGTPKPSSRPT